MRFLPHNINWVSPYDLSSESYQPVLVATHKHSHMDWHIEFGAVNPIENYTNYKIMVGNREIPKAEILAIGIIKQYGYLNDV